MQGHFVFLLSKEKSERAETLCYRLAFRAGLQLLAHKRSLPLWTARCGVDNVGPRLAGRRWKSGVERVGLFTALSQRLHRVHIHRAKKNALKKAFGARGKAA